MAEFSRWENVPTSVRYIVFGCLYRRFPKIVNSAKPFAVPTYHAYFKLTIHQLPLIFIFQRFSFSQNFETCFSISICSLSKFRYIIAFLRNIIFLKIFFLSGLRWIHFNIYVIINFYFSNYKIKMWPEKSYICHTRRPLLFTSTFSPYLIFLLSSPKVGVEYKRSYKNWIKKNSLWFHIISYDGYMTIFQVVNLRQLKRK